MSPVAALSSGLRGAFRFGGRASRAEFWWTWTILYVAAMMVIYYRSLPGTDPAVRVWCTVILCAIALPMISAGTRRLNDAGFWRWWFVVTFFVGVAAQLYYFNKPTRLELQFWQVRMERADIDPWLSGYQIHDLLRWVDAALPWIARPLAILCLVLALFPSRMTVSRSDTLKVTP